MGMGGDLLSAFDDSGLDLNNTVVRCSTQEEADMFLKYLYLKAVWEADNVDTLSDCWENFGSATCYHISERSWCYDSWYKDNCPDYRIVDFWDIYKGNNQHEEQGCVISFDELMQGVE
jgi:hypothetical protein